MQARTTSPQAGNLVTWLVAILGVGLLVILLLSFILEGRSTSSGPTAVTGTQSRLAYFEFGRDGDTLWLVNPADPSDRSRLFTVPHAPNFGVVPSVSPDGRSFVFTALAPETLAPSPNAPAGLWLASVGENATPRLLANSVDLLVEPAWSTDSRSVVYRRSITGGQVLAAVPVSSGEERVLASSETSALFPVAFTSENDGLYYVAIDESTGSRLFKADLASGVSRFAGALSLGLTRDWSLSPDGESLAYLEIGVGPDEVTSRALVMNLKTETSEHVTGSTTAAFGPTWTRSGELIIGSLDEAERSAALLRIDSNQRVVLAGSEKGFEVPLAAAPAGDSLVVRAFARASSNSPGPSSLAFVGADGVRQTIATGEVTFVGWTNP